MANQSGEMGGKVPPDNLEGAVRWVWHPLRQRSLTNSWDRLMCRPKAYELGITEVESGAAADQRDFLRVFEEFQKEQKQKLAMEYHFQVRGVEWGWRYDKGLAEVAVGASIQLMDVLPKDAWIATRTDTPAWKKLPDDEKNRRKIKIKELKKQILEGIWKPTGTLRKSSPAVDKAAVYKQVQTVCIKCFQELGVAAEFTKDGNIIRCMSDLATTDWPNDWIEWVTQNAGQIIKGVEIEK